ncbi:hypothetical protein AC579_2509 [Pseudocercospora musae]|uniref:Uncharacterized protein n=1 Tax=Pseudocercospora musae TaxID=113226 RepID=A0A139I4W8_9PEZI|nr:hypothetical protein AC579_2509 [Pseudocercospora musae]
MRSETMHGDSTPTLVLEYLDRENLRMLVKETEEVLMAMFWESTIGLGESHGVALLIDPDRRELRFFGPQDKNFLISEWINRYEKSSSLVHALQPGSIREYQCAVCQQPLQMPVAISELQSNLSPASFDSLLSRTVDAFVRQNSDRFSECPTPDCGYLYRASIIHGSSATQTCSNCFAANYSEELAIPLLCYFQPGIIVKGVSCRKASSKIYRFLEGHIASLESGWKRQGLRLTTGDNDPFTTLTLEGTTVPHIAEAVDALEQVLRGFLIEGVKGPYWPPEFTGYGRSELRVLECTYGVIVEPNADKRELRLVGEWYDPSPSVVLAELPTPQQQYCPICDDDCETPIMHTPTAKTFEDLPSAQSAKARIRIRPYWNALTTHSSAAIQTKYTTVQRQTVAISSNPQAKVQHALAAAVSVQSVLPVELGIGPRGVKTCPRTKHSNTFRGLMGF